MKPGLQTQLVAAVDPLTDCELLLQATQVLASVAPVVVEYVLTPQLVHIEAFAAEYFPASQIMQVVWLSYH